MPSLQATFLPGTLNRLSEPPDGGVTSPCKSSKRCRPQSIRLTRRGKISFYNDAAAEDVGCAARNRSKRVLWLVEAVLARWNAPSRTTNARWRSR